MPGKTGRTMAAVIAAIASLATSPAVFAIKNQVCPNCSIDRMIVAARAFGLGQIYVWDPHSGDVRKYVSYCGGGERISDDKLAVRVETAPSPFGACGNGSMATDELPVESEYADAAPHLGKIWLATNGTWVIGSKFSGPTGSRDSRGLRVSLPAGFGSYQPPTPTAHDFMLDAVLRAKVGEFVDTDGLTGTPADLQAAIAYVKAKIVVPPLVPVRGIIVNADVVFADGSRVAFTQRVGGLPRYVAESGRDTAGFAVPEANTARFAGNWTFGANQTYARDRLIELFGRLNASITYAEPGGSRLVCPWDGHTLHCTVRR